MIELLGLAGLAGSGKDTAAKVLRSEGWHQIAYADILREVLEAIDPIVGLDTNTGKPKYLTNVILNWGWNGYKESIYRDEIRRLIQRTGTEGGRDIHGPQIWINHTFERMIPDTRYIISDVRFPNEAKAIWDRGGKVIWIGRPARQRMEHSSETSFTSRDADAIVHNDDSHEMLRQRLLATIYSF